MNDEQRERAIHSCGLLMEAAMQRYAVSYDGADREEADRYRSEMESLIAGRTPLQVRQMEVTRGLARA